MAEKTTKKDIQATEKKLILIDLDGTTLDKDFRTFNQLNQKVLTHLHKLGHKVCIATGRNYLSALPYYEKLGLNTLMATYNGAYINNPKKEKLKKAPETLNVNHIPNGVIRGIMQEKIVKDNLLNSLGEKNALQLVLEFANNEKKLNAIISALRSKYHSSVFFDVVNKLKKDPKNSKSPTLVPDPEKIVIRIRSAIADKGRAAERLAVHYNIPLKDTVAFGDSENDIEMIRDVG
ncbi:1833_t:CDS:2 [Entrophospora sp. SA101]|nr:1833_t:CDS:2 [Entrophospora sp. SA101]